MTIFVKAAHLQPYRPSQAAALRLLWQSQRKTVFGLWSAIVSSILGNPPAKGTGPAYGDPRVFEQDAKNPLLVALLVNGLEGLFARDRPAFERWLWKLVTDVRPKLLYDALVSTLDGHGTGYSRRLAAMIHEVTDTPGPTATAEFKRWASSVRYGVRVSRGAAPIGSPVALVVVPGRSLLRGDWGDSSAKLPSHDRAKAAMPTIDWLLKRHGPQGELMVLCSGGMVKSPTPESAFIAAELRRQMAGWSAAKRRRVVLYQDPMARHTASNARTLSRLALMSGVALTNVWVVTGPFHYSRFWRTFLRSQWKRYEMAGLLKPDRDHIKRVFPLTVRPGTPLIQKRTFGPAHRGKLSTLASTALVPAPGNALDP
jgi:hypothetical protein